MKGIRWAPKTLLYREPGLDGDENTFSQAYWWGNQTLGKVTESGLAVRLPGFSLRQKVWDDLPVRNPWQGLERFDIGSITFTGPDGWRYRVGTKDDTRMLKPQVRWRHTAFLEEQVERGSCHIIIQPITLHTTRHGIGMIGQVTGHEEDENGETLLFKAVEHVHVPMDPDKYIPSFTPLSNTAQKIAYDLRKDPLTIKLATMLAGGEQDGYDDTVKQMQLRIKAACVEAVSTQDEPRNSIDPAMWGDPVKMLRVFVRGLVLS